MFAIRPACTAVPRQVLSPWTELRSNRVYTESINDHQGMINIRALMGVCPQFDMLWDKLTADEHMEARYGLHRQYTVAQLEHF